MENLLEVQQLNKSYKNSEFQLTDITFSVKPGEVVGLIGKNLLNLQYVTERNCEAHHELH